MDFTYLRSYKEGNMTIATNQNMTDMTNNSSIKYDEYHNLSVIEELGY
jgi:hypothetical protein